MALLKIKDFDPDYTSTLGGEDIKGYDVYTEGTQEKIGTVDDILVDENTGEFRYLLVALGVGTIGKKVLLPVGRSLMKPNVARVYARISKEQAYNLPELESETTVDYDYEERVRGVYRPNATMSSTTVSSVEPMVPVDTSAPLETSAPLSTDATYSASGTNAIPAPVSQPTYNRDTYTYQQEPSLYEMNPTDHQTLRLYEERITANKRRIKTGEVAIGKHVETETAQVSVPVEKERVVIERVTPPDAGRPVSPGTVNFSEGEVAHMEIYEETPDIRKEAFVREEVRVNKVVEQDTVEAQETIRREELDVDTEDLPVVDAPDSATRKPRKPKF
jgi:uncharacterized protein (TIGR02271 family)